MRIEPLDRGLPRLELFDHNEMRLMAGHPDLESDFPRLWTERDRRVRNGVLHTPEFIAIRLRESDARSRDKQSHQLWARHRVRVDKFQRTTCRIPRRSDE